MVVQFGLELDEQVYPLEGEGNPPVQYYCGERNLLQLMEKRAGISYPNADEYLRIEQYRQLLTIYAQQHQDVFYRRSLEADALATASAMLERRDELLLAGWNFAHTDTMPNRLRIFADLEALLQSGDVVQLATGKAERWRIILDSLAPDALPFDKIYLNEPLTLLPPYLQAFFNKLKSLNVAVLEHNAPINAPNTNLGNWQRALLKKQSEVPAFTTTPNDHSIIILRSERETQLAAYLAKLTTENPQHFRPLCLVPNQNRALDNALIQEGVPSLGILSTSMARPTLQILKLVSAFLCDPINPYKILEFLSLPNRPLHDELARKIAESIAEKPGLHSNVLAARVKDFFEDFEKKVSNQQKKADKKKLQQELKETQETYQFFFKRTRYNIQKPIPKFEIASVFRFLHIWSLREAEKLHKEIAEIDKKLSDDKPSQWKDQPKWRKRREELQNIQKPILALNQQAGRVWQIVEALPERETHLTFLQLERLIRTISEAAPIRFRQPEQGHLPYIYAPSAITQPAEMLMWWNFNQSGNAPLFSRWYNLEVQYLSAAGVLLDNPQAENERRLWQNMRPVLQTSRCLILALPAAINGEEAQPHLLWSDLQAVFKDDKIAEWTIHVDKPQSMPDWWKNMFRQPALLPVVSQKLEQPPIETEIPELEALLQRNEETFSSLETLLYAPHQWVFNYLMKLRHSSILDVVPVDNLKGNLAHSVFQHIFEEMKKPEHVAWSREELWQKVEKEANELMRKEGTVLMMYGKEPERVGFVSKLKTAVWALVEMIRSNHWKIAGTELPLTGQLDSILLKGTADLVLERDNGQKAVVDLKWGGMARRKEDLKNNHDLQLVIYSKLLGNGETWADTSFFIIENAKALARNRRAFRDAQVEQMVDDTAMLYQSIWEKIKATYRWRMEQLQQGKIEIRTEANYEKVEEHTQHELAERALYLLEMRKDKVRYDKYKPLIGELK